MSKGNESKQTVEKTTVTVKQRLSPGKKIMFGTAAIALVSLLIWLPTVNMADTPVITVYKSPTCGCCNKWIDHLREEGFSVVAHNRQDMNQIKESHGVDYKLRSCHTATVDGYVVEGHVPAKDIRRLLRDKPVVTGLAVPGMPAGSPGMEGKHQDPYDVIAFTKGKKKEIYARY